MIEIRLADGELVAFHGADLRRYKGVQLPGSVMTIAEADAFMMRHFVYEQPLYRLELVQVDVDEAKVFTIKDVSLYAKLQIVLQGELKLHYPNGEGEVLLAGEINYTTTKVFQIHAHPGELLLLQLYIHPELLQHSGMGPAFPHGRSRLSPYQRSLLDRLLHNPFPDATRAGYSECCVREFLFLQGAQPRITTSTAKEDAAIYAAANMISANLHVHYSIAQLAKMTHTNAAVIKEGFQRLYKVGPYSWRLQLKMERAQFLLSTTDEPIQSVANYAGYREAAAFVREFKKRYRMTPKVWRREHRENS